MAAQVNPGDDLRTLFMAVSDTSLERLADNRGGDTFIEAVSVDVPGFTAS